MNDESDFDAFIEKLHKEIEEDELKTFSKKVIEEYHHPKNWGKIDDANAQTSLTGSCGDTMKFYLFIKNNIIKKASFITDGCGPTVACGSKLTTMITNMNILDAKKLTPENLIDALDGLPPENEHCALLAIRTLNAALQQIL